MTGETRLTRMTEMTGTTEVTRDTGMTGMTGMTKKFTKLNRRFSFFSVGKLYNGWSVLNFDLANLIFATTLTLRGSEPGLFHAY